MHIYLWKRLVKDTTRPGRTRWILTALLVALAAVLLAALILPRVVGLTDSGWYAWPGYLWFGLVGVSVSHTARARARPARAAGLGQPQAT